MTTAPPSEEYQRPHTVPFAALTPAERNAALETLWAACVHASQYSDVDAPPIVATVFHSSAVPGVSLSAYVTYILRRVTVSRACVSIALVLVQRYWAVSEQRPSALTAHRLTAAALLLAMKVHHDVVWRNSEFADACALPLAELNRLEVALLVALDFDAHVTAADVSRVVGGLLPDADAPPRQAETLADLGASWREGFALPSPNASQNSRSCDSHSSE